MEINARLPGTLELAMRAGVNFPQYLWNWGSGAPLKPFEGSYKVGVRLRYLYGDIQWLQENLRRSGRPESVKPAKAVGMFSAEFFRGDARLCRHPRSATSDRRRGPTVREAYGGCGNTERSRVRRPRPAPWIVTVVLF